ncbi:MAG TPA: 23S rRNA (adenine(2503)-C(2))-methyltransferase RlmN [Candidatus Polarisedimenticolia bacterium]|jgi:23S rRNA (adenine2503-C2)-methyltransferase
MTQPLPARPSELLGADLPALEHLVEGLGEKRFHARQIYHWVYARRVESFERMTSLSRPLREKLAGGHTLSRPRVVKVQESSDGTRKYLMAAPGGGQVESVWIPEEDRLTFCISPQIGCALDCHFCLTAQLGLVRHLTAGEIVGQVLVLLDDNATRARGRPVNIVMMGMGEALHNYDNAVAAVRLLADAGGVGIPRRRITLSTAGMAPGILRLAAEPVRPRLAVSLNATTDAIRSRLMPVNRRYPLDTLLDACRRYPLAPRERLTFEYVLLRGINDSAVDPPRLAALINRHQLRAKVNLIPFNEGGGLDFAEPSTESVQAFRDDLLALGVPVSIRRNRGRDISAACGQLALTAAAGRDAAVGKKTPTHN